MASAFVETLLAALLPGFEGRYAFILGMVRGLSPWESFAASLLGALILSLGLPPILGGVEGIVKSLACRGGVLSRLSGLYLKYASSARGRAKPLVDKYGFLGLIIFVSIPIPVTGIWTGSIAAHLLGMGRGRASAALFIGGLLSILIVGAAGGAYWRITG